MLSHVWGIHCKGETMGWGKEGGWWGLSDWYILSSIMFSLHSNYERNKGAVCVHATIIQPQPPPSNKAKFQKSLSKDEAHQAQGSAGTLEPEVPDLLPHGQRAVRSALGLHLLAEVELAAASIHIDGGEVDAELEGAAVGLVADEE
jgi:hypothetical protein